MIVRLSAAFLALLSSASAAPPCTAARPECAEWVVYGAGPSRSLIYRTHSLDRRNDAIRRALVVVHGMGRDADSYFRSAVAAAFLAGALDDTAVISLRLASNAGGSCADKLAPNEVSWPCDVWRSGGPGASDSKLTSFDFADEVLRKLASRKAFPNLKSIVLTGHSAGGQFAERYAMGNTVHEKLGVSVTYVVSNPSSYGYLDATRPRADGKTFGPYAGPACPNFDRWPYGMRERAGSNSRRAPSSTCWASSTLPRWPVSTVPARPWRRALRAAHGERPGPAT